MTLDKPVAYFLYALTYTTGFVVKRNLPIGARMTTDPALIVGAGPFMLKGGTWQYRRQITLVPNPHFYGARGIKLKELDLVFVGSIEAAFTAYRSGQYPTSELPAAEVARYRGTPEYRETPLLSTTWYGMNRKYPPFHNRHFRRAVAFALNRDPLVYGPSLTTT